MKLAPEPIVEECNRWLRFSTDEEPRSIRMLADRAGVGERTVRQLLDGETTQPTLDVVDRLAMALGSHLSLLYPYGEERRTHCKHGHELTPENTYVRPSGTLGCRVCSREQGYRYQARKKAAA